MQKKLSEKLLKNPQGNNTSNGEMKYATVLYSYERRNIKELTIEAGSWVEVLNENLPGGWCACRQGEKTGYVPQAYLQKETIEEYNKYNKLLKNPQGDNTSNGEMKYAIVVYSYERRNIKELTIEAGSWVEVLNENLPGGWCACRQGEKTGYVPQAYLQKETIEEYNKYNKVIAVGPNAPLSSSQEPSPVISPHKPTPLMSPLLQSPLKPELGDTWRIKHQEVLLDKQLGSGGCGAVYQATWQGIKVAVKQLHGELTPGALAEFQREAEIAAGLHYPHVVQLYGVTQEAPYYMVMEYMPKGSLYDVLRKEDLNWEARTRLALKVARGLSFLHEKNIIHRDIKSLNVLIGKNNEVKLADFGLSTVKQSTRTASKESGADGRLGTLHWKAPELFKIGANHTRMSDVYSLGIVFWEIVTGRLPYAQANDEYQISLFVRDGQREGIPLNVPSFLKNLIERCWAQHPNERPALMEVITELKQGLNHLKGKTVPQSKPVLNILSPVAPAFMESGGYIQEQRSDTRLEPQVPVSGHYIEKNNSNPNQDQQQVIVPQPSLSGNYRAPGNRGLFPSRGRSVLSPPQSGTYVQPQNNSSSNNNNNNTWYSPPNFASGKRF